jgi:hypothetical protein
MHVPRSNCPGPETKHTHLKLHLKKSPVWENLNFQEAKENTLRIWMSPDYQSGDDLLSDIV